MVYLQYPHQVSGFATRRNKCKIWKQSYSPSLTILNIITYTHLSSDDEGYFHLWQRAYPKLDLLIKTSNVPS